MTQFHFNHDSRVWLTSDTHFGHVNIIKYCNRPWADADEMNEGLVRLWNDEVPEDAEVLHIGDVAMGKIALTLPLVSRLNGVKHLITGNHDRCYHSAHRLDEYKLHFQTVDHEGHLLVTMPDGKVRRFYLNHLPYSNPDPAHEGNRAAHEKVKLKWPEDHGESLVCGHVHDAWRQQWSHKGTPMYNVGADVHGWKPVSLQTFLQEAVDA